MYSDVLARGKCQLLLIFLFPYFYPIIIDIVKILSFQWKLVVLPNPLCLSDTEDLEKNSKNIDEAYISFSPNRGKTVAKTQSNFAGCQILDVFT